jgi:FlaA1/EpsC-like NDP-sugar epimerase
VTPFSPQELRRLLGRPVRAIVGPEEREALAGRRVLVTGAGGSIGSALARELAACGVATLGLVDHSEHALFVIEREIRSRWPRLDLEIGLVDVTRGAAIRRACERVRPFAVYHAAAYKHVTMAERAPAAAANVNVLGTVETAMAAADAGARFLLISSDKAADPTSVMGATKRLSELAVRCVGSIRFRPLVVRFGNVLGSSGSVLEIMRACVRAGRPIPLTDPDATRYFMTAGEAVALVLRADRLGRAAEICWLEMGRPVRMGDLAARVIEIERAAGYDAVPIEVIGLRPGEKRNETLDDAQLRFERSLDRRILVARDTGPGADAVAPAIARLRRVVARADDAGALEVLASTVAGFAPSEAAAAVARQTLRPAGDVRRRQRVA